MVKETSAAIRGRLMERLHAYQRGPGKVSGSRAQAGGTSPATRGTGKSFADHQRVTHLKNRPLWHMAEKKKSFHFTGHEGRGLVDTFRLVHKKGMCTQRDMIPTGKIKGLVGTLKVVHRCTARVFIVHS